MENGASLTSQILAVLGCPLLRLFFRRPGVESHAIVRSCSPDNRIALVVVGKNDCAVGSAALPASLDGLALCRSLGLMPGGGTCISSRRAGDSAPCLDPVPGILLRGVLSRAGYGCAATNALVANRVLTGRAAPFSERRTDVHRAK